MAWLLEPGDPVMAWVQPGSGNMLSSFKNWVQGFGVLDRFVKGDFAPGTEGT